MDYQAVHSYDLGASEPMEDFFMALPEASVAAPQLEPDEAHLDYKPCHVHLDDTSNQHSVYEIQEPFAAPAASSEEEEASMAEYMPSSSGGLTVCLFHKTRGGKGAWLPISTMQLIRVTKGIGKRLRMEIKSTEMVPQPSDIKMHLFDVLEDHSLAERDFTIETSEISHAAPGSGPIATTVTLELKVFHLCKNLQFHANFLSPSSGNMLNGTSVQFSTHDSGKQRKKSPSIQIDSSLTLEHSPASSQNLLPTNSVLSLSSCSSSSGSNSPMVHSPRALDCSQSLEEPLPVPAAPVLSAPTLPTGPLTVRIVVTPSSPLSTSSAHEEAARAPTAVEESTGREVLSQAQEIEMPAALMDQPHYATPDVQQEALEQDGALENDDAMDTEQSSSPVADSFQPPCSSSIEMESPEDTSSDGEPNRFGSKKRKIDNDLSISVQSGFQHFCPGSLDVHGIVRAQGFVQYSDIRLKTNVEDIMDALQIVTQLQGKRYQWKEGFDMNEALSGGRKVIGLIAQEVRRVLPEVVVEDKGGFLAVNYADLVPVLVEALKQHVQTYESDKKEIKTEINELREKIDSFAISTPPAPKAAPSLPSRTAALTPSKGVLLTPGFRRSSAENPNPVQSAAVVVLSGWSQWSTPATSNPSLPNNSAAETIARSAADEIGRMYPGAVVATHSLMMGTSVRATVEDISAAVLGKSKLRQDLEHSQLVWFIGESHGTVPLTIVCDRLVQLGLLSSITQQVCFLSIGGIHHHCSQLMASSHPNPFVQTGLHDFQQTEEFTEFKEALGNMVEHDGVSVVMVGAYEDTLMDLSSSLCDQVQHPNILRSLYVSDEHKAMFNPNFVIKMADNVPQEMLLFALELKNSGRELDMLPCISGSTPGDSLALDTAGSEIFTQNHTKFSLLKLHQLLFGTAELPSTVASFYYALNSTFSMFTPWGYSFYKFVQGMREGLVRHQNMFSHPEVYSLALEWFNRPSEQKMVASTRKMVYRDVHSRAASPISPRHKFGSMFDPSEQLDPAMAQWVYSVKKLETQFGTEKTSRMRSAFRYWTPSLPKEQALKRAMQKHLGWGVRASLFGICPGQFLDGFAERVAAEKEREMQQRQSQAVPSQ